MSDGSHRRRSRSGRGLIAGDQITTIDGAAVTSTPMGAAIDHWAPVARCSESIETVSIGN
jgi:hypothetical protein